MIGVNFCNEIKVLPCKRRFEQIVSNYTSKHGGGATQSWITNCAALTVGGPGRGGGIQLDRAIQDVVSNGADLYVVRIGEDSGIKTCEPIAKKAPLSPRVPKPTPPTPPNSRADGPEKESSRMPKTKGAAGPADGDFIRQSPHPRVRRSGRENSPE